MLCLRSCSATRTLVLQIPSFGSTAQIVPARLLRIERRFVHRAIPASSSSIKLPRLSHASLNRRRASTTPNAESLRRTPLHDLHLKYGAKMVPFGGFSMPVIYADQGVGESHQWTREKASLFDVSHMVQHRIEGPGAEGLLCKVTPAALSILDVHRSTLSCLLHPGTGGIVDDTVITRLGPQSFYVVTNAACRDKDTAYLRSNLEKWTVEGGAQVDWNILEGQGLIAIQGPIAAKMLEDMLLDSKTDSLTDLYFGQSRFITLRLPSGVEIAPVLVSRGGYTGEDGFEISVSPDETMPLTEALLQMHGSGKLRMAGLGARDSLRLEAGMCLYGHDLDDSTTPVEGALAWTIAKDRRDEGGFHGAEVILRQLKSKKDGGGVERRRVGLVVEGAPAREGAEIIDKDGNPIGKVTSGCPSPTLKKNIAMGYLLTGQTKLGNEVWVMVRGKKRKAVVTKMPFVPSKYWKGGASPG